MELEELKNTWIASGMLQKDFTPNEQLIKKMLQNKSSNALNKIINVQVVNLVIMLLITPLIVWLLTDLFPKLKLPYIYSIGLIYWLVIASAAAIFSIYVIIRLFQFDFTKPLNFNLKIINRHKPSPLRVRIVMYFIFALGFIPTLIINWQLAKVWLWVFLIATLATSLIIGALITKRYNQNVKSVISGLEELKELEENNGKENTIF